MNVVIITGASSGIGREFAKQLDKRLMTVDEFWLIARRKERMEELAKELDHVCKILPMDLTDASDLEHFMKVLENEKPLIRMLINCSGYGIMGRFEKLSLKEQRGMLTLNCQALTDMTYYCIPYMSKKSRIIQLASSAAFLPQPNFAIYAATKSYVLSFSRALAEELRQKEIYVTAVCPGPVRTEFFNLAEKYGTTLAIKKLTYVNADRVVSLALRDSLKGKQMSVCSPLIRLFWFFSKLLPHQWILGIMRFLK